MNETNNRLKKESKNYTFLTGDVNFREYGGSWYRCTGEKDYYVIESVNVEDYEGFKCKYLFTVYSIDLDSLTDKQLRDALKCFGWENEKDLTELMLLEACISYGHADIEQTEYSNNFYKTLAELKKQF